MRKYIFWVLVAVIFISAGVFHFRSLDERGKFRFLIKVVNPIYGLVSLIHPDREIPDNTHLFVEMNSQWFTFVSDDDEVNLRVRRVRGEYKLFAGDVEVGNIVMMSGPGFIYTPMKGNPGPVGRP